MSIFFFFCCSRLSSRQYKILTLEDMNADDSVAAKVSRRISSDDTEVDMTFERVSIGLMDDPEIQKVFKRSFSLEDVTRLQEEVEEELTQNELVSNHGRRGDRAQNALVSNQGRRGDMAQNALVSNREEESYESECTGE